VIVMNDFLIIDEKDIKSGVTTDKYFIWTEKILKSKNINPNVVAEITTKDWGVFSGLIDVLKLLEGREINVYSIPEGSIFYPNEPVMILEGKYLEFARLETSLLGFICHSSGVTKAAFKAKFAAKDRKVLSFGTRRQHPALAAMIERAAWIGGVDGVSNYSAEKYLGIKSIGTMPHALIICFGNQLEAWKAFDEVVDENVPRILLIDTYCDEKTETITAIENLDKVDGIRLDTPSSRRGDIKSIIEEIKWELYLRDKKDVKIVLSGGVSFEDIVKLREVVDVFGVGTAISCAKSIDFALDIVEKEGKAVAKRGKFGGRKYIIRDEVVDYIFPEKEEVNGNLHLKVMENGEITKEGMKAINFERARELSIKTMKKVRKFFENEVDLSKSKTPFVRTPYNTDLEKYL